MAWYDRLLGRTIDTEEKLNPAQSFIALEEGLTLDTRETKDNYRSAYEELEVVNRAVNMIVDDVARLIVYNDVFDPTTDVNTRRQLDNYNKLFLEKSSISVIDNSKLADEISELFGNCN